MKDVAVEAARQKKQRRGQGRFTDGINMYRHEDSPLVIMGLFVYLVFKIIHLSDLSGRLKAGHK